MGVSLSIEWNAGRVLNKLTQVDRNMGVRMSKAFSRIGSITTRDMKKKLSGESHTLHPNTSNPYPGVVTGRLRSSVHFEQSGSGIRTSVRIGPDTNYAAEVDDKYPYVRPTWLSVKAQVIDLIHDAVRGAMR